MTKWLYYKGSPVKQDGSALLLDAEQVEKMNLMLDLARRLAEALSLASEEPFDFWPNTGVPLLKEARAAGLLPDEQEEG